MTFGFGQASNRVTVEIVGDADQLRRETTAAERLTRDLSRNASNDLKLLKNTAVGVATGIGAVGAAVGAIAVRGGIDRLMGLERATRQLDQLGVSTQDSKRLTDSLLESLLGTPFALDKGAASLAGFVASGRDLADIPRLIQQVTDTAAFGNITLEEIDFIWQRIQTTGRVTNRELRMLAERNIPVYSQLAAAIGVTGQEVFDMARTGELSADLFFDSWEKAADGAVEGSVRIAGAAKAMGDTTDGAWANMRTAMSRFGATLLEDVFPMAKDAFNQIGEGFNRMGEVFKRVVDGLDFSNVEEFIARIPEMMEAGAESVVELWQATEVLRDVAADVFRGIVEIIKTGWIPALGAALLALKALYAHPVIAGLGLVAWVIGKEVGEAAERARRNVDFLTTSLQDLADVEAERALTEWLTPHNIKLLTDMGIEIGELARLLREGKAGTAEWDALMGPFIDKYGHWTQEVALGRKETLELVDALEAAAEAQGRDRDAVAESAEETNRWAEAQRMANAATEEGTAATERGAQATEEATELTEEQIKVIDEYKKALDGLVGVSDKSWSEITNDVESFLDGFKEVPDEADITMAEFEENFRARAEAMRTFWQTIHSLMGIEGTQALVNELIAHGPSALPVAQEYLADPIKAQTMSAFIEGSELGIAHLIGNVTNADIPPIHVPVSVSSFTMRQLPTGEVVPSRTGQRAFQHGGIARARPGGIDGRFAEAGSDEGVIPLDERGARFMAAMFAQLWERLGLGDTSGDGHSASGMAWPGSVAIYGPIYGFDDFVEKVRDAGVEIDRVGL